MGLYDTINVYMTCPYCGHLKTFNAQTKDLGRCMYNYSTLSENWKKDSWGYKFRKGLPVFPEFPFDKSHKVWKSQAEHRESSARVGKEFEKLKYVEVITSCNSVECQFYSDRCDIISQSCPSGFGRTFRGKIKIHNGHLVGDIYDIKKDKSKSEKALNKYKNRNAKKFQKLLKKYKHEPIVCRNWGIEL